MMPVTTPASRTIRVPANKRLVLVPANNRVVLVPANA